MLPPRDLAELKDLIARRQIHVPRKLQRVLSYVFENPADVAFSNARDLARNCDVSNATVIRTAQALGFDGFKGFRDLCRHEIRRREH